MWGDADDKRLRQAALDGLSSFGASLRLHRGRHQCEARARELGLTFRRQDRMSRGLWNTEREEAAAKLWADGRSASQIADRLGGGVTRNAVIGKLHRMGVSERSTAAHKIAGKRPPRPRMKKSRNAPAHMHRPRATPTLRLLMKAAEAPLPPPRDTDIARVSHNDLNDKAITITLANGEVRKVTKHCKWPCADPRKVGTNSPLYCGDERVMGLPYCEHHAHRAYNTGATMASGNKLPAPKMPVSMASPMVLARSPA